MPKILLLLQAGEAQMMPPYRHNRHQEEAYPAEETLGVSPAATQRPEEAYPAEETLGVSPAATQRPEADI